MKIGAITKAVLFVIFSPLSFGDTYWDKPVTGEVKSVLINSPFISSRDIIVELKDSTGTLKLCEGSSESGYINKDEAPDTYSAFLSVFLSEKVTKNEVIVHTADGPEGCRIDLVRLN